MLQRYRCPFKSSSEFQTSNQKPKLIVKTSQSNLPYYSNHTLQDLEATTPNQITSALNKNFVNPNRNSFFHFGLHLKIPLKIIFFLCTNLGIHFWSKSELSLFDFAFFRGGVKYIDFISLKGYRWATVFNFKKWQNHKRWWF